MKKAIFIMVICIFVGISNAALVTNGDFTENAAEWGAAGGGTWSADDTQGYAGLQVDAGGWAVWYQVGTESLAEWGIPVGTDVVIAADIKALSGGLDSAALKIEAKTDIGGANGEYEEVINAVTTSWAPYQMLFPYTIPTGTASLKAILVHKGFSTANYGYDNVEILVDGGTPALKPIPILGAGAGAGSNVLSWINPDPNGLATVTADVYLLESATELPDPNTRVDGTLIADDITTESVDVTLTSDRYYYWVVDVTVGGSLIQGFDWDFQTFDSPPTVDAGVDQYLVTTGSGMLLNLDATVTDDEDAGPVTITWTDLTDPADKNPNTTVEFDDDTIEDPTITLTNAVDGEVTGYYIFEISVDDGVNDAVTGEVIVNILGTCGEAADADPDDDYDITGDLNLDCKKNLADFAIFAAGWLDCDTNRPDDVTCP